jgi:L-lactate dehydrogenase complex protein LldE
MKIGLFVPCYIDQFYPQVAIATLELLKGQGCDVVFPLNQTCCGQPMANSGFASIASDCNANFLHNFARLDYIVTPSGSCALHVKEHVLPHSDSAANYRVFELCEFLTDVLEVKNLSAQFPHRVGWHNSCHGQRMLGLSSMSEKVGPAFSKPLSLLRQVQKLTLADLERNDECCGFGGTFCVTEEAISTKMGKDRVADHTAHHVEYITGGDMSCLMHLEGILRRQKSPIKIIHIAEILNAR